MPQFGGKNAKKTKKTSSDSKRHFTVVMGNKEHGLYVSSTPSSAARKAVTKLCAANKSKKVEFSIREITQGSKKKTYGPYEGYIEKLKEPIELKGRVIRYKPVAKLNGHPLTMYKEIHTHLKMNSDINKSVDSVAIPQILYFFMHQQTGKQVFTKNELDNLGWTDYPLEFSKADSHFMALYPETYIRYNLYTDEQENPTYLYYIVKIKEKEKKFGQFVSHSYYIAFRVEINKLNEKYPKINRMLSIIDSEPDVALLASGKGKENFYKSLTSITNSSHAEYNHIQELIKLLINKQITPDISEFTELQDYFKKHSSLLPNSASRAAEKNVFFA
jgi:hypothetical protein